MTPNAKKITIIAASVIGAIAIGILIYFTLQSKKEADAAKVANQQLALQNQQLQLAGEYEQLNNEYHNFESQTQFINNDSILNKYGQAKDKVEKLLNELKTQKITSTKRIKELQNEIKSLKGIMRHYVQIIDSLNRENQGLKAENIQIKTQNQELNTRVNEFSEKNANLSKRMTLAEKINITSLSLSLLKGNGKNEKNIKKAKQLMVSFTVSPNNSTPVGEKTFFVRITNPEGTLLDAHGSFPFEGGSMPFTERKTVEYTGQEIPGVAVYWNVNTALTPGQYTVEVFADNYRLSSRSFTLK